MAKEPKNPKDQFKHSKPTPPMIEGKDGPIPWENWDNDQRAPRDDPDTSPGSMHDIVRQAVKNPKK